MQGQAFCFSVGGGAVEKHALALSVFFRREQCHAQVRLRDAPCFLALARRWRIISTCLREWDRNWPGRPSRSAWEHLLAAVCRKVASRKRPL